MFRFFNKKDDGAKSGPPGHRGSQQSGADDAAAVGGGFFNLPPPLAKQPVGAASPAPHAPPSSYSRPTALPGAYPPQAQPQPQPPAPAYTHSTSSYEAAPVGNGAVDMFGGMALKNPPANPSAYAAPPAGGSLFSGLDLAAGGLSAPLEDAGFQQPPPPVMAERRKSATRSFNYLDVAGASTASADTTLSRTSSNASGGARSVPKVVKRKKTKSFRPGFGRQLSDESVAALQRGDIKEEDIVQAAASDESPPVARPASNPNDLAHLLPPVGAGSVLSGLTVHKTTSSAAGGGGGGGGVLAGLTVHAGGSSPRHSARKDSGASSPRGEVSGSVLAGLNVHQSKASTSVKRESSRTDSLTSKEHAPSPAAAVVEPPAPVAPAAPPTPEERLLNTLRDFHASAVSFRENVLRQSDDENRILERKVYLANQLTQYEIDLRDVEAQQHHACEVEDFERADALNATINSVRHCITLTESDVRKVDSELAAFVKAKEKAFANQLRSTRGTLRELEKFREDQEAERTSTRREFQAFEATETAQLQFEAERIDTEMHHVSANLAHLAAEKAEIEATIDEQCKDEFVVRAQLLEERALVEEEVRELERKLKLKLERVRTIQGAIDKAEKDIDIVRTRYSRQLKRVADREAGILQTKREVEADVAQLTAQKQDFRAKLEGYDASLATFGKRIAAVRKEMRAAALLARVLEVQETRREQSLVRKKQQAAELSSLSDAAAVAEQSFVMLRKQRDELEKSLSIHRNAIASAESLIPRLEGEKKTAAAQRNFKEAARISKDVKALEKDRATAEEMVEVVEMELQDLAECIGKRAVEFEDKTRELQAVEKQLELAALQELWKEARHLRTATRQMAKLKSEGVAAESGVDFRASALLLVQAELEACAIQAEALEHKYGVSDPVQDAEEEDDEDEDGDDISDDDDVRNSAAIAHAVASGGGGSAASDAAAEAGAVDVDAIGDGSSALEEIASKLSELEALIDKATENEEYELAARLDEKVEVLKQRQLSMAALASREAPADAASEENEAEDEEDDDEEEGEAAYQAVEQHREALYAVPSTPELAQHATHNEQTIEELTEELEALRQRIIHVEDDIDLATQNEEYESAAAFDEELQELRAEQEEIRQLLEAAKQRSSSSSKASSKASKQPPVEASASGLFLGLGVRQPSFEADVAASTMSVTRKASNESAKSAATDGSSLFGGLELSGSTSPRRLSKPPSPIETAVLASPVEAPVVVVVASVASVASAAAPAAVVASDPVNSPTSYSQVGPDSFFGGLQMGRSTDAPLPSSPSTSMFGGLQLSASAEPAASPVSSSEEEASRSVFSGLATSETGTDVVHAQAEQPQEPQEPQEVSTAEEPESSSVLSAEPTNAMFAGLRVSVSSAASHESHVQSRTGSASSLIDDEHSTDSPMTIHELSDHTAGATDDESLSGSLVSHESSSFADISFTSTSLTTITTTTTTTTSTVAAPASSASSSSTTMTTEAATVAAPDSLFGGLSLMQSAPAPAAVETDDEDSFDDAKQEL